MRKRKYGILSLNVFSNGISWSFSVKDRIGAVGEVHIDFRDRTYKKLIIAREFILKIISEYKPSHVVIGEAYYNMKPHMLKVIYGVMGIIIDRCLTSTTAKPKIISDDVLMNYFDVNTKSQLYSFIIDSYGWEDRDISYETHKNIINSIAQSVYYFEKFLGGHNKNKDKEVIKEGESLSEKFMYF